MLIFYVSFVDCQSGDAIAGLEPQAVLRIFGLAVSDGLEPVLEAFDLPAPYRPFNIVFFGQLSGDDFTNSSTRQEPGDGRLRMSAMGQSNS
jgi:hypothetical protein